MTSSVCACLLKMRVETCVRKPSVRICGAVHQRKKALYTGVTRKDCLIEAVCA
ncbi:unnamed protein product [Dicrocoelium dendriticum]|nr:unnamed protein product [Dicrocoelium dendriticum]